MTSGTLEIGTPKVVYTDIALAAAATTAAIDLEGGTLVSVSIPELTSTTFTITVSTTLTGTYRTVRDAFGLWGTEDTDVSAAIGTTSVGFYPIPDDITKGIRFFKLVFSSSETATITVAIRSVD